MSEASDQPKTITQEAEAITAYEVAVKGVGDEAEQYLETGLTDQIAAEALGYLARREKAQQNRGKRVNIPPGYVLRTDHRGEYLVYAPEEQP